MKTRKLSENQFHGMIANPLLGLGKVLVKTIYQSDKNRNMYVIHTLSASGENEYFVEETDFHSRRAEIRVVDNFHVPDMIRPTYPFMVKMENSLMEVGDFWYANNSECSFIVRDKKLPGSVMSYPSLITDSTMVYLLELVGNDASFFVSKQDYFKVGDILFK